MLFDIDVRISIKNWKSDKKADYETVLHKIEIRSDTRLASLECMLFNFYL